MNLRQIEVFRAVMLAGSVTDVLSDRLISFSRDTPQGRIIDDWCTSSKVKATSSIEVRSGQMAGRT